MIQGMQKKYDQYWVDFGSRAIQITSKTSLEITHVETEIDIAPKTILQNYLNYVATNPKFPKTKEAQSLLSTLEGLEIRKFELKYQTGNETKTSIVYQVCTSVWPDHGVISTSNLITLVELCRFIAKPEAPMVVHCSYVYFLLPGHWCYF
jgi:protein tyrosine phosphatase